MESFIPLVVSAALGSGLCLLGSWISGNREHWERCRRAEVEDRLLKQIRDLERLVAAKDIATYSALNEMAKETPPEPTRRELAETRMGVDENGLYMPNNDAAYLGE